MTRLALGAKCEGLGATGSTGLVTGDPSAASSSETMPGKSNDPHASERMTWRWEIGDGRSILLDEHELVTAEQDAEVTRPRPMLGVFDIRTFQRAPESGDVRRPLLNLLGSR